MSEGIFGMETGNFIALFLVVAGINLTILYFLIRYAVKANSRNEILYTQARLLSMLLIQQGVSRQEIRSAVEQAKDDGGGKITRDWSRIIPGLDLDGNPIEEK